MWNIEISNPHSLQLMQTHTHTPTWTYTRIQQHDQNQGDVEQCKEHNTPQCHGELGHTYKEVVHAQQRRWGWWTYHITNQWGGKHWNSTAADTQLWLVVRTISTRKYLQTSSNSTPIWRAIAFENSVHNTVQCETHPFSEPSQRRRVCHHWVCENLQLYLQNVQNSWTREHTLFNDHVVRFNLDDTRCDKCRCFMACL